MGTFNLMICEDLYNRFDGQQPHDMDNVNAVGEALQSMRVLEDFTDKNLLELYH